MQLRQNSAGDGSADSHHLGHVLMDFFNTPEDHLWQIDAGTGESEMKSSVKRRSIQLARCFRNAGLKPGDIVTVSGLNHLDVHIPFYAGYLNGLPISGIDPSYRSVTEEIKNIFQLTEPKLVFCETTNVADYEMVIKELGLDTIVVTFGDSDKSYANFVKKYDDNTPDSEFKVATFDTNKVFAWLISTSGTTGLPKVAAFSHPEILKIVELSGILKAKEIAPVLSTSSVQWISGYLSTLSMFSSNQIKIHTSMPATVEHIIDIINKYRPTLWTATPFLLDKIMQHDKYCDMTCFKTLIATGFAMHPVFLEKLKSRMGPNGVVWNLLGQTECIGAILLPAPDGPHGNCGTELKSVIPVKLVDPNSGEDITEPNKLGELWTKGPRLTEYYRNPVATAACLSPDGWFKTGDLLYKDENGYFFFVERISSAFRYRYFFVTPLEVELVIRSHPDVLDVCVVGVPHPEDYNVAVACVQKRPGSNVTEQDIKDLVASKLSSHKQIHGGVIFVDDFPRTISDKINRSKVRDFVIQHRNVHISEYPEMGNTKKLIRAFSQLEEAENSINVRLMGS